MGWRDRLRPAAYRGAPFFIEDSQASGGRRLGVHVYPLRETPYVEDLGRKPRRFKVTGFVIEGHTPGSTYMEGRDLLQDRLETRGPRFPFFAGGTLIHPYLGSLEVVCESYTITETKRRGRMATFNMTFMESGFVARQPAPVPDGGSAADTTSVAVTDAAGEDLEERLVTTGAVQEVRDASAGALSRIGAAINALDVFSGPAEDVALLKQRTINMIGNAQALAISPAELVASVVGTIDAIFAAAADFPRALEAYSSLFDLVPVASLGLGGQDQAATLNSDLVIGLATNAAFGGASRSIVRVSYESLDDATGARDLLLEELDREQGRLADSVWVPMQELRTILVNSVPPADESLPRLRTIRLQESLPSVLVAWNLYGDRNRDTEINARNRVVNPGFVAAGVDLEVLADV